MARTNITMARSVATNRISLVNYPYSLLLPGTSVNSVINVGTDVYNYERTQPFSICFWINPTSYPTGLSSGHVFSDYLATGTFRGRLIRIDSSGVFKFWLINTFGSNELRIHYQPPPIGMWTRVVVTYSGNSAASGVKCYFNNILQTQISATETLTATIVSSGINTRWGNWGGVTNLTFPMYLAKPSVLNYEMTAQQISDDYFSSVWSGTNPIDYYNLTEGSGTSIASSGSGANTATLGASVTWSSTIVPRKSRTAITQSRIAVS